MVIARRILLFGLFLLLLGGGWSFAHGNHETISVDYIIGHTVPLPVWMLLLLSCVLGVGGTGAYLGLVLLRGKVENRRLRKAVKGLENELRQFRNRPIAIGDEITPADDTLAISAAGAGRSS